MNNAENNYQITDGKNKKVQEIEDIEKIDVNTEKEIEQNKVAIHTTRRSIHNTRRSIHNIYNNWLNRNLVILVYNKTLVKVLL